MSSDSSGVDVPDELRCPISCELFQDPVLAADGFNYEREHIEAWLRTHDRSPLTNAVLRHKELTPSNTVRGQIARYLEDCRRAGRNPDA